MQCRSKLAAMVVLVGTACEYTSHYVPPDDSRARPVWIGRSVVPVGPTVFPPCSGTPAASEPPGGDAEPQLVLQAVPVPFPVSFADDDDDDDGDAVGGAAVAAAAVVLVAAGLASTALGLAIAPAGTTRANAATIDDINAFNDELRRPTRCSEPEPDPPETSELP
jgi:hypothetical protein